MRPTIALSAFLLLAATLGAVPAATPAGATDVPRCLGARATIIGTAGPDHLVGTPHRDVVVGLGGDDVLEGADGSDLVCGGPGNDQVLGGAGLDDLSGGPGNDLLDGGTGGNGVPDYLEVDPGNDRLVGSQDNTYLNLGHAPRGMTVDLAAGTVRGWGRDRIAGVEQVNGGPYGDVIKGDGKVNLLNGDAGTDRIYGRGGTDWLTSEDGQGRDQLFGQDGDDFLYVGDGSRGDGGSGDDAFLLWDGATGLGRTGADTFTPMRGVRAVWAVGDGGGDVLDLERVRDGLRVDVEQGLATGPRQRIRFRGTESFVGTRFDDVMVGSAGSDRMYSSSGRDVLRGRGGDDQLVGGRGEDDVDGGPGSDGCDGETVVRCEAAPDPSYPRGARHVAATPEPRMHP